MPRKRMIDPSIWTDEDLGGLGFVERLLFIGLISHADDEGYVRAHPAFLKACIFPYDDISVDNVCEYRDTLLLRLRTLELLEDDGGKEIIRFVNWTEYQKINKPQVSKQKSARKKKAIPLGARREIARRYGVDGSGQSAEAECHYCGAKGSVHQTNNYYVHFRDLEIDHIIPESQGGSNEANNLVLACMSCNRKRANTVADSSNLQVRTAEVQTIPRNRIEKNRSKENTTMSGAVRENDVPYTKIVGILNETAGTQYSPQSKATRRLIHARWNEGFRLTDFEMVIKAKWAEWSTDEKMVQYIRPQTLFNTKFEAYLQRAGPLRNGVKPKPAYEVVDEG